MYNDLKTDKNKFLNGLLVLISIMLLVNVFYTFTDSDKIDFLKDEIKKTNTQINAVYDENRILESKIEDFKTEIHEIDKGIDINNRKIENLNIYEKDKINSFATYGNVEWEKYFADRYK